MSPLTHAPSADTVTISVDAFKDAMCRFATGVLPHSAAVGVARVLEADRRIAAALGKAGLPAATAIWELERTLGAPASLR
jgi:hypothetical protein